MSAFPTPFDPRMMARTVPSAATAASSPPPSAPSDAPTVLAWCLQQHMLHHGGLPGPGGRNSWLASLAFFCNERGVPQAELLDHAASWQASDFTLQEIRSTIQGIYTRKQSDHASIPYSPPAEGKQRTIRSVYPPAGVSDTPPTMPTALPASVYEGLPHWLRRCCERFTAGPERDVMLLSTLTVLSGCFATVSGIYDGRRVGLNLFTFVLAPAASGKGALGWARRLAWPWHQRLTAVSRQALADYQTQLQDWKVSSRGKHASSSPAPQAPAFKQLYLPANTSASALMQALADNDGRGIICETEADTLTGALGQDFGNFSDLLRKAFHHEPISLMRKTDRQHLELATPALSVALTGTPAQLRRLIPTAEDGLFSRFLFYTFNQPAVWRDVSPQGGRSNFESFFAEQATHVTRMIRVASEHPITFALCPAGWARVNSAGNAGLQQAVEAAGSSGASSALRLSECTFRIAGILALLRCFETSEGPTPCIVATEQEVETALQITATCREHALYLLATLPVEGRASPSSRAAVKVQQQEQALALHSAGQSVRQIAATLNVSKSTVSNWTTST